MEHKRGNGDPFPKKIQFTRYNYSFHARLIQASPEVQSYYTVILTAVRSCPQMRVTFGWRQVYVHIRRRQVAQMVFKGQTLCIALAIDPVTCGESKRRVEDVSRFKRFAKTPLMVRLVSRLRLRSALTLLETAAGVGALPPPGRGGGAAVRLPDDGRADRARPRQSSFARGFRRCGGLGAPCARGRGTLS